MKSTHIYAIATAIAFSTLAASRGDLIVRKDGTVIEGKVLSRDAKGLSVQIDGETSQPPVQLAPDAVARVIQIDDHGAETAEANGTSAPAKRPDPHWDVPAEPAAPPIAAPSKNPTFYVIPLHGVVGETYLADALEKSLADAEKRKPTVVVLDINSPGGLVNESELMVKILHHYNKDLRIVALVDQDLSASAITTLSVRTIYMKSTGTIGAATAFDGSDSDLPRDISEKFQSAWRAVARNSAEEGNHEPLLAEAMIDSSTELHLETTNGKKVVTQGAGPDMIVAKGKILTLTSHEAVNCGLAADIADDFDELGEAMNFKGWKECPGLGTVLADYIPKRRETFLEKSKQLEADIKQHLAAAESIAPWEGQQVSVGSGIPGGFGGPRVIMQMRTLTAAQRAQWKGQSLAAVVAFQKVEQDIQNQVSMSNAFGQKGAAEELKEPLAALAAARANIYADRNKHADDPVVVTIATAPPLKLKNAPLPAQFADSIKQAVDKKNYKPAGDARSSILFRNASEDTSTNGGILIGLRCGMDQIATGNAVVSLQPIYLTASGVVMGKLCGNPDATPVIDLVARDGYAVGGAKIGGNGTIDGLQLQFVRISDGHLATADSYWSDAVGRLDSPNSISSDQPTIGIACRTINNFCAMFTLLFVAPPDTKPVAPPVTVAPQPPAPPVPARPAITRPPASPPVAVSPPLDLHNAPLTAKFSDAIRHAADQKDYAILTSNPKVPSRAGSYQDVTDDGGLLIGVRCGMGKEGPRDVIMCVQPIYLTAKGAVLGKMAGNPRNATFTDLVARDGYAVGGLKTTSVGRTEGISLRFVRIADGRVNPMESYDSDAVGNVDKAVMLSSTMPIIGMAARSIGTLVDTISLVGMNLPEAKPLTDLPAASGPVPPFATAFAAAVKTAVDKKTYEAGGLGGNAFGKTDFEELAPDGGILIGFRCGRGKSGPTTALVSIQPIFLTGRGEVLGQVHGDAATPLTQVIKAPPGFAVAGITVGGLTWLDNLAVTYMKIGDRMLLQEQAYKTEKYDFSDGIGRPANLPDRTMTFGGDGTPVIGINGKDGNTGRLGLGLIFAMSTPLSKGQQDIVRR